MRTLLLSVLVSFNLVACVAGDNGAEDQDIEGIDGIAEVQGEMDVGMSEHQVKTSEQSMDVDLQARPGLRKNKYKEAASEVTLDGELARAELEQDKLGRDIDAEQEELYNPNRIEQVDMVELLRGIQVSR